MTFQQLYLELIDLHFGTQEVRPKQVKGWINTAEVAVWNAAPWEFKRVSAASLTVTAGAASEPADFGKAIRVYDTFGDELEYLPPDEFEENYVAPVPGPSGNAEAYTVIDRQILVGPPQSGTFKLAYQRRYSHKADGGAVTAGVMNSDLDTPLWDPEHHYILVPWAMLLGARLENDEAALALSDERDRLLKAMREEHVGGTADQIAVWGGGGYAAREVWP